MPGTGPFNAPALIVIPTVPSSNDMTAAEMRLARFIIPTANRERQDEQAR